MASMFALQVRSLATRRHQAAPPAGADRREADPSSRERVIAALHGNELTMEQLAEASGLSLSGCYKAMAVLRQFGQVRHRLGASGRKYWRLAE